MISRRCLGSIVACLLAATALLIGLLLGVGHWLALADSGTPADAIVVLGGESLGFPRVQHALTLYRAGRAPVVVFSGGILRDTGLACSSARLSQEAALQIGLPFAAAMFAPEAQSTYDEAVNLGALAAKNGWHSLLLVTDRFHTRRALRTFQALAPDATIAVSAPDDPRYAPDRWWTTEDGLVAVVTELLKLGFYWARYGIASL